jgi:hypothetical protein
MANNIVLDIFEREFPRGDGCKAFHPIGDGELFGCEFLLHRAPPIHVRPQSGRQGNPENAGIANEL